MIYRTKAIVVPFARLHNSNQITLPLFRDTSTGEWTFVSGGCKPNEDAHMCAARELQEESRNTLDMSQMTPVRTLRFNSSYRPPAHLARDVKKKIKVITRCTVFVVQLPFSTLSELANFADKYRTSIVSKKREFNETNDVDFVTLSELEAEQLNLWSFMRDEVVPPVVSVLRDLDYY